MPNGLDRLTDAALSGAGAGAAAGQAPIFSASTRHFAPGTQKYDNTRDVYNLNANSFVNWRLAFANQRNAQALARIATVGDSITSGGTGVTSSIFYNTFAGRLRTRLDTLTGVSSGTGFLAANSSSTDAPLQLPNAGALATTQAVTGSWSSTAGYGLSANLFFSATAGSTWTLTWTGAYSLRMLMARGVGGTASVHTTNLDGSASTTLSNSGTGQAITTFTTAGSGSHTFILTVGTGTQCNIAGVELIPQANNAGIQVYNCGIGSTTSAQPLTTSAGSNNWYTAFNLAAPKLAIYMYGTNDMNYPTYNIPAATTYTTNVQSFITNAQANSCDVLLMTPPRDNSGANNWYLSYINVLYALADLNNVPLLDLRNRYAANPNSYMDSIGHPSATTAFDMAAAIYNVITAQV